MEQSASDIAGLSERLKLFAGKIDAWRRRAAETHDLADKVVAQKSVDAATLVEIEQTGTDIRDALRLVLLEITELGTRMYAVRWQVALGTVDAPPAAEGEPGEPGAVPG